MYGPTKFNCLCGHDRGANKNLLISPNPAYESITINANNIRRGRTRISIVNMIGKNVFDKTTYNQSDLLREKVSISGWQKGIYFVSIIADGKVVRSGSFLKE